MLAVGGQGGVCRRLADAVSALNGDAAQHPAPFGVLNHRTPAGTSFAAVLTSAVVGNGRSSYVFKSNDKT